jgi:hypothetical protein
MAFDYIFIRCVACKGRNNNSSSSSNGNTTSCPECKGKGKRRVDINYHPISEKPFTDEEYELIISCMKQMFNSSRGEGDRDSDNRDREKEKDKGETPFPPPPPPGFNSYRARKPE